MENFPSELDLKNLVRELSQGRELAKQLRTHINAQSSSSHENREFLLQRILYSYDQALSMLTHTRHGGSGGGGGGGCQVSPPLTMMDSPRSLTGSPHSDDSDQEFKDQASRKRNKAVPRWSKKIKVCPEAGIEGQLDDGHGWRKYGQKDILGAKYPRGYYRCTYRHAQDCYATKQVQRSDDDPTIFEITYRRKHTCNPSRATATNNVNNPPAPIPDPHNEDPNRPTQSAKNEPLFNIQTSLRVITQDLGPNGSPSVDPFNFSSSINPENNHNFLYGNDILENSNGIPTNDNNNYGGLMPDLLNSGSELSPVVAAMTSTTNSPTFGTDFPFDSSGFGPNFSFGNPGFYP